MMTNFHRRYPECVAGELKSESRLRKAPTCARKIARNGAAIQPAGQITLLSDETSHVGLMVSGKTSVTPLRLAERCTGSCGASNDPRHWNGGVAGHLRMDDGLSAWMARTRLEGGDGKRISAAGFVTSAYGDAVLPQIPEAICRAILRVERALDCISGAATTLGDTA